MAESKSVVIAALFANGAIAVLKFVGFLLTGSAAMLSETYHSISDTGNQIFLLIGIRYGQREATRGHPFGYGKAQFFYSFLVSVLLFGIAGWESAKHGYDALMHPHAEQLDPVTLLGVTFAPVYVNYAVLVAAILFETYAFMKAYRAMKGEIERRNWSGFREAFRKTSNVTTLTALTEDTIALAGAGIALLGVYLSRATGNPMYDAASAFLIGLMLMGFAVALAWENKRLLLGESLPKEEERPLRELLAGWDGVVDVVGFRTVYFGPKRLIVTADVAFDSTLDTDEIDDRISDIEDEMMTTNEHVKKIYIEPEVRETTSKSAS
ncbi:cation transporter [halophilic archaeon]|nr:cation transporter [halophilic archaeon]